MRRTAVAVQRQLTRSLGGTYHQLADTDIPAAVLAFAHAENATQLVLGATHPHGYLRCGPEPTSDRR